MSILTGIEWCDSTVNASSGCNGCELWSAKRKTCYAGRLHPQLHSEFPSLYAPEFTTVATISGRVKKATEWPDLRNTTRPTKPWLNGFPRFIFVGDMGDFLSREIPDSYVIEEIIQQTQTKAGLRHFWLFLTKRPSRLAKIAAQLGGLPSNIMAMTTITNQETANKRIPALEKVQCHWRGISAEPLFESIQLPKADIHWLIAGGESGPNTKPLTIDALDSLHTQCSFRQIPFFFKQWGGPNKKAAGRNIKGTTYSEMPKIYGTVST